MTQQDPMTPSDAQDVLDSPGATAEEGFYQRARVARDKLNAVLDDLSTKADQAGRAVKRGLTQAEASVKDGLDVTERKIRDYPFVSVGIAAGVGLIVGLLLNRRH